MNLKRMVIFMILIVLLAAAILIYEIKKLEEDPEIITVEVEPIPVTVYLPIMVGELPEEDEVKVLEKEIAIDEGELDLLSRLIQAEAGSDWCTDELQKAVGSVVLNRMSDSRYPSTMHDVIYQAGQYSTASSGQIEKEATERAKENARYLLENGVTIPEDVVFQANFKQGKIYKEMQGVFFGR